MLNRTWIHARDTYRDKNSVVDKCILDKDSACIAPHAAMVYHAIDWTINESIQTARPRP